MLRDYVEFWYQGISKDDDFTHALRGGLQQTLTNVSNLYVVSPITT